MTQSGDNWSAKVLALFNPIYRWWMLVVGAFSWLVARVVAIILFITAFLAYGIVMRIVGFDPLDRQLDESRSSYWTDTDGTNSELSDFRKQY